MLKNFPLDAFDRNHFQNLEAEGKSTNRRTLGFGFKKTEEVAVQEFDPNSFDFIKDLALLCYQAESLLSKLQDDAQGRVVLIDPLGTGLLDFDLTPEQTSRLIQSGYSAASAFFSPWIMNEYARNPFDAKRLQIDFPSPNSISRKQEKEIFDAFAPASLASSDNTKTCLLFGHEKMGKTTIAKRFAWSYQRYFSSIFMFDGSEKDQQRSFALARLLEVPSPETLPPKELLDQICASLENHQEKRPYLLIFDCQAWDQLPKKGGCVLLISEEKTAAPSKETPIVEVNGFSTEEALRLFEQKTGENRSEEMKELVENVRYFPQQAHEALLPNETLSACLEKTAAQKWKPRFEELKKYSPQAFHYLGICSCLPKSAVPLSWLESWIPEKKGLTKEAVLTSLQNLGLVQEINDEAMILKEGAAEALLKEITMQEKEQCAIDALYLFAKNGSPDCRFKKLEDHAGQSSFASVLKTLASSGHSDQYTLEFIKSAVHLGNRFIQSNRFHQGKELLEIALEKTKSRYLEETPGEAYEEIYYFLISPNKNKKFPADLAAHYARCLYYYGTALSKIADQTDDSEQLREAESYFERAVSLREQIDRGSYQEQEKYHVDTVIFQRNGRGWIWLCSDDPEDWKKAEELYLKLHNWTDSAGKADPFNQALCKQRLSRLYLKWARASSSYSLYQKAKEQIGAVDEEGNGTLGALLLFTRIEDAQGKKYDRYGRALLDLSNLYLDPNNPYFSLSKANNCIEKALDRTDQASQPRLLAELHLQKGNYHFLSFSRDDWTTKAKQEDLRRAVQYAEQARRIYLEMEKTKNPESIGIEKAEELQRKCREAIETDDHPSWSQQWIDWMFTPTEDKAIQDSTLSRKYDAHPLSRSGLLYAVSFCPAA